MPCTTGMASRTALATDNTFPAVVTALIALLAQGAEFEGTVFDGFGFTRSKAAGVDVHGHHLVATLDEPACGEATERELLRHGFVETVEGLRRGGLTRHVERFGRAELHACLVEMAAGLKSHRQHVKQLKQAWLTLTLTLTLTLSLTLALTLTQPNLT